MTRPSGISGAVTYDRLNEASAIGRWVRGSFCTSRTSIGARRRTISVSRIMWSSRCGSARPAATISSPHAGSPSIRQTSGIQKPSRTRETMIRENPSVSASDAIARIAWSVVPSSRRRDSADCTRANICERCARRASPSARWRRCSVAGVTGQRGERRRGRPVGERVGDVVEGAIDGELGGVLRGDVARAPAGSNTRARRAPRRRAPRGCARAASSSSSGWPATSHVGRVRDARRDRDSGVPSASTPAPTVARAYPTDGGAIGRIEARSPVVQGMPRGAVRP